MKFFVIDAGNTFVYKKKEGKTKIVYGSKNFRSCNV